MLRGTVGLRLALALAVFSLASGQFFVNLGDKTKAPGTDVDTATGQGTVATPAATDGDVSVQADPNVKLQVTIQPKFLFISNNLSRCYFSVARRPFIFCFKY
jgi:hypothetical protein